MKTSSEQNRLLDEEEEKLFALPSTARQTSPWYFRRHLIVLSTILSLSLAINFIAAVFIIEQRHRIEPERTKFGERP